jgi:GNAT superfamily N-acetyltransferase
MHDIVGIGSAPPNVMIALSKATESDLSQLRELAVLAFADDEQYKPVGALPGGPPSHDSIQKHREWLNSMDYHKCTQDGEIIGSCILDIHLDRGTIHGIHVKPESMGKGIGSWILSEAQRIYPQVCSWILETPDYAKRNHLFYEKNGFTLSGVTPIDTALGFGFYIYKKVAQQGYCSRRKKQRD